MQAWMKLSDKFTSLSVREKWLIAISGLVGLFFILLTILIDPSTALRDAKNKQEVSERTQITRLKAEIKSLQQQMGKNPDEEIDQKLQQLSDESQELSLKLAEFVSGLLSPSEMSELLEEVLDSSVTLKLESLQSLPAEPIVVNNTDSIGYFVHPVQLELTGKFFDIQAYLSKLESMRVQYFWRSFHYEVEEYPRARLTLVVYTLGTQQEFIGG